MAGSVSFAPLGAGDIEALAPRLRAADRAEIEATLGPCDVREVLHRAAAASAWVEVAFRGADPFALFGVAPRAAGGGSPWFVGTDVASAVPLAMVRHGRRYVARMLAEFGHLANHVDARNAASVRWLKRLGFEVFPAEPFGAAGLPFRPFRLG